jgi:ribose transport system substrate-binding protein
LKDARVLDSKILRRVPTLIAVTALLVGACTSATSSTAPSADATTAPSADATTAPTEAPTAAPTATPKPLAGKTIGFAQLLRAGCDFCAEVEKNINTVFTDAGATVFTLDNEFNVDKTLANVDTMVSRQVDALLCFCPPGSVEASLAKARTAGIPYIGIDGVPKDTGTDWVYFGANGEDSGQKSGLWVVDFANASWGGEIDDIATTWIPEWEPDSMGRVTGFEQVLNAFDDKFTMDSITKIDAKLEYEKVLLAFQAFLNAHPDDDHLVLYGPTSDVHGLAAAAAARDLNREEDIVALSHGADAQVRGELSDCDSPLKASLAYFPDRYGEFLLPVVTAVLTGAPHQQLNFTDHQVVDCNNVKQFYPNDIVPSPSPS